MSDPLHNSKYSIDHAKRRISEFEREVSGFINNNPCNMAIEFDSQARENVYKVKLTKPMPISLAGIAFDIVTNLRSSLDQLGYSVAIANGTKGNDAHFPFGGNSVEILAKNIKGRSKDIPKIIFDIMIAFKPYKGGNDLLWSLNKLCNTNKHEIVVPMIEASSLINASIDSSNGVRTIFDNPASSNGEMILARVAQGGHLDGQFKYAFDIAINNTCVVAGKPAIATFHAMCSEVENILIAVEAGALRMGLFK